MELENESTLRAEQLAADKRTIEMLESRIKEIEQPAFYLKEQVKMSEIKATKLKSEVNDLKL